MSWKNTFVNKSVSERLGSSNISSSKSSRAGQSSYKDAYGNTWSKGKRVSSGGSSSSGSSGGGSSPAPTYNDPSKGGYFIDPKTGLGYSIGKPTPAQLKNLKFVTQSNDPSKTQKVASADQEYKEVRVKYEAKLKETREQQKAQKIKATKGRTTNNNVSAARDYLMNQPIIKESNKKSIFAQLEEGKTPRINNYPSGSELEQLTYDRRTADQFAYEQGIKKGLSKEFLNETKELRELRLQAENESGANINFIPNQNYFLEKEKSIKKQAEEEKELIKQIRDTYSDYRMLTGATPYVVPKESSSKLTNTILKLNDLSEKIEEKFESRNKFFDEINKSSFETQSYFTGKPSVIVNSPYLTGLEKAGKLQIEKELAGTRTQKALFNKQEGFIEDLSAIGTILFDRDFEYKKQDFQVYGTNLNFKGIQSVPSNKDIDLQNYVEKEMKAPTTLKEQEEFRKQLGIIQASRIAQAPYEFKDFTEDIGIIGTDILTGTAIGGGIGFVTGGPPGAIALGTTGAFGGAVGGVADVLTGELVLRNTGSKRIAEASGTLTGITVGLVSGATIEKKFEAKILRKLTTPKAYKFTTELPGRGKVTGAVFPDVPSGFNTNELPLTNYFDADSFFREGKRIYTSRVQPFKLTKPSTYFDALKGKKPGQFKRVYSGVTEPLLVFDFPSEYAGPEISRIAGRTQDITQVSATDPFTKGLIGQPRLELEVVPGANVQRSFAGGQERGFFSAPKSQQFGYRQAYGYYAGIGREPSWSDLMSGKSKLSFGATGKAYVTIQPGVKVEGLSDELFRPISRVERESFEQQFKSLSKKNQKYLLKTAQGNEDNLIKYIRFARERNVPGTIEVGSAPLANVRQEFEVTQAPGVGNILVRNDKSFLKNVFKKGDYSAVFPGSKKIEFKFVKQITSPSKTTKASKSFVDNGFSKKNLEGTINYFKRFEESSKFVPTYSVGSKISYGGVAPLFSSKYFKQKSFSSSMISSKSTSFSYVPMFSSGSIFYSRDSFSSPGLSSGVSFSSSGITSFYSTPSSIKIPSYTPSVSSPRTPSYTPSVSSPRTPPINPPRKNSSEKNDLSSFKSSRLFMPYVRRKNNTRWVKASKKPLPYNSAFNQGLFVADNSTARTVKLEPRGRTRKPIIDDSFINSSKFRKRKLKSKIPGKERIFVEKNKYILDSIGEKKGLSAKKLLSKLRLF